MKILIIFILILISILAKADGGGGTSGGNYHKVSMNAKMVRAWSCGHGESGMECRWITFKYRPPSPSLPEKCTISHGEFFEVPCSESTGLSDLIQRFNRYMKSHPQNVQTHTISF